MLKKEIYPKTKRLSCSGINVYITKKLDGSNMCIFKKNGLIYVALRNNIVCENEVDDATAKQILYKGLHAWLNKNLDVLRMELHEGSVVCGEWLGMGYLKYGDYLDKHFYMFAKANVDDGFNLYNLIYTHDLFIYPFVSQIVPDFIGVVPEVRTLNYIPTKEDLDKLYEEYGLEVGRPVEGFVINYADMIHKYVRLKRGKLTEHFDRE